MNSICKSSRETDVLRSWILTAKRTAEFCTNSTHAHFDIILRFNLPGWIWKNPWTIRIGLWGAAGIDAVVERQVEFSIEEWAKHSREYQYFTAKHTGNGHFECYCNTLSATGCYFIHLESYAWTHNLVLCDWTVPKMRWLQATAKLAHQAAISNALIDIFPSQYVCQAIRKFLC